MPRWAQATLSKHARDKRDPVYSPEQFEVAQTHDPLWNAAQKELLHGKTHGYYRMYWGKKIIEWSQTPAEALRTMIYLNDRYVLDGGDPNGYTNIPWCCGLHDLPSSAPFSAGCGTCLIKACGVRLTWMPIFAA